MTTKFIKQPADVQDYDIDYSPWLTKLGDTIQSFTAVAEAIDGAESPPVLDESVLVGNRVKVWMTGGVDGAAAKVTVTVTTAGGRVKQHEIVLKVKEL